MVSMSIMGSETGRPLMRVSRVTASSPPLTSDTSVEVPPMSKPMASPIPTDAASHRVATAPPAGPLSTRSRSADLVLSGPAGGAVATRWLAASVGIGDAIGFDMGGTSTDISLVSGGELAVTRETRISGLPVSLPMIDIETIGAGGGSIAYLDRAGALRVGPRSAGADPGPACYGRSLLPTVTDANMVLGRLEPSWFAGGTMKLYPERSRRG